MTDQETDSEGTERALETVLEPVVRDMGFELLMVEWIPATGRRILRVYLDHPEGVTLDDCARLGRIIGNALDAAEVAEGAGEAAGAEGDGREGIEAPERAVAVRGLAAALASPYTLEVSSPGIERPLTRRSHYTRFSGERVKLRTRGPVVPGSAQRTFHGTIVGAEPDPDAPPDERAGVVVIRELDSDALRRIDLRQIRRAKLVFEG